MQPAYATNYEKVGDEEYTNFDQFSYCIDSLMHYWNGAVSGRGGE